MVEDEEHLRQFTAAILERAGFSVLQACDANEAVEIWQRERSSIDLLLADILIPGLSGPEIAREFLRSRPDLKVIFTSGNDQDVVLETAYLVKGATFLQKPYTTAALVHAVRSAFDERS